jgi:hypothetical protein
MQQGRPLLPFNPPPTSLAIPQTKTKEGKNKKGRPAEAAASLVSSDVS